MEGLKKRLLRTLKKLKGVLDDQSDDVFLFAIETAIYDVLNYCHFDVEDWPEALDNTAVLMAIDILNETHLNLNVIQGEGDVKSLSEGSFSISKETKAEAFQKIMQLPSFSRNYKRNLNRFRKLAR